MKIHRAWFWGLLAVAAVALASCSEQINQLKARQAFKDANAAYIAKDYPKAIENYSKAIELDPTGKAGVLANSYFYLGSSHHLLYRPTRDDEENQQHLEKAIEHYKKILEIDPEHKEQVYKYSVEQLAGIYRDNLDDLEEAEKYFFEIIKLEPNKPENYYALGALYERFHDPEAQPLLDKALEAYQKPIEFNPNDPAVYRQVAGLLNKYGRFDETMEYLNKAKDVAPNDPTGYYIIATYYWDKVYRDPELTLKQKQEYIARGLEVLEKARELKPDYVEALVYTNLLLREQAKIEPNPRKKQQLMDEADRFRDLAMEIKKEQEAGAAK